MIERLLNRLFKVNWEYQDSLHLPNHKTWRLGKLFGCHIVCLSRFEVGSRQPLLHGYEDDTLLIALKGACLEPWFEPARQDPSCLCLARIRRTNVYIPWRIVPHSQTFWTMTITRSSNLNNHAAYYRKERGFWNGRKATRLAL